LLVLDCKCFKLCVSSHGASLLWVSASPVSGLCLCISRAGSVSLQAAPASRAVPSTCQCVESGEPQDQARRTESRMGSWTLRLVLVWKLLVRSVESGHVCNLQNVPLELKFQGFVLHKCTRENNSPAMKFSLLLWETRSFPGRGRQPALYPFAIECLYSPEQV